MPQYYTVKSRAIYISSRASYSAIDRYDKFAYFNLDKSKYAAVEWIPGAMNQHGESVEVELFIINAHNPARGFARFSDYAIIGLSGATALIFLAGMPILVVVIGILIS